MDERSPGSYRLSIRGNLLRSAFGVRNVKIYWDGVPFTDASGNSYLNAIPATLVQQAEIIRGLSGSMYGAGTGGVLLLGSAPQLDKKQSIKASINTGSYGYRSAEVSANSIGRFSTFFSATHLQQDGYRDQSAMQRDAVFFGGSYQAATATKLSAKIFYSKLRYETPGGLTLAQAIANPKQSRPAAGTIPSAAQQQAAINLSFLYFSLSGETRLSTHWKNTTGIYGSYDDFQNPSIRNYEDKYERGFGGRTVFTNKTKNWSHIIGAEYQRAFVHTGTYDNVSGTKAGLQYLDEIGSVQYNAFAQSSFSSGGFSVSGGLSYNRYQYNYVRLSDQQRDPRNLRFSPEIIPRLAVAYQWKQVNLYTNIGKGFSPPSIDEVHASDGKFNTSLRPENATNIEIGAKLATKDNKLTGGLSLYQSFTRQTIVSRRDSTGAEFYLNAGRTSQKGIEAELRYQPLQRDSGFIRLFSAYTAYTVTNARFREYTQGTTKFDGNKLTGTPDEVFAAGIAVGFPQQISLSSNYSYTGMLPLNDANTFVAASYQLLSTKLGVGISFNKYNVLISGTYNHAFNTPYSLGNDLNAAGNRFYNPSAPQSYTIGVRVGMY